MVNYISFQSIGHALHEESLLLEQDFHALTIISTLLERKFVDFKGVPEIMVENLLHIRKFNECFIVGLEVEWVVEHECENNIEVLTKNCVLAPEFAILPVGLDLFAHLIAGIRENGLELLNESLAIGSVD